MPAQLKWVIEDVHVENGDKELAEAAKSAGHTVCWLTPLKDKLPDELESGAIFHGSIEKATEIQAARKDIHIWLDPAKFLCSAYYPKVGKYLFNQDYVLLPVAELIRQKWTIYRWLAKDSKVFVRPDSGLKTFTGRVLDLQDFDKFWINKVMCSASPESLVVITSPQDIQGEWRFVVSPTLGVIAGSTYLYQSNRTYIPSAPREASKLCEDVLAAGLNLGPLFVLDVAQRLDGSFGLLEANAFSTAALYACDKTKIVKAVEQILDETT